MSRSTDPAPVDVAARRSCWSGSTANEGDRAARRRADRRTRHASSQRRQLLFNPPYRAATAGPRRRDRTDEVVRLRTEHDDTSIWRRNARAISRTSGSTSASGSSPTAASTDLEIVRGDGARELGRLRCSNRSAAAAIRRRRRPSRPIGSNATPIRRASRLHGDGQRTSCRPLAPRPGSNISI